MTSWIINMPRTIIYIHFIVGETEICQNPLKATMCPWKQQNINTSVMSVKTHMKNEMMCKQLFSQVFFFFMYLNFENFYLAFCTDGYLREGSDFWL